MSERTFEECKEDLEKNSINKLDDLFELWREAHGVEVDEIFGGQDISKDEFEKEIYKKKGNTISSHFTQFFEKECDKCKKAKNPLPNAWEIVLKKAFNMDGTYDNFDVKEGGYRYICLLKEANDSKKMCIYDYLEKSDVVNEWIVEEGRETCGRKYKSEMLNKLNMSLAELLGVKDKVGFDFKNEMAFMNVNKRGGRATTAGRDETAVINYAEKYKDFILREIEILSQNCEKVSVFVCGSKSYFVRLMGALHVNEAEKDSEDQVLYYKNIKFVNIPHPSNWRVSVNKLAEEMNKCKSI